MFHLQTYVLIEKSYNVHWAALQEVSRRNTYSGYCAQGRVGGICKGHLVWPTMWFGYM